MFTVDSFPLKKHFYPFPPFFKCFFHDLPNKKVGTTFLSMRIYIFLQREYKKSTSIFYKNIYHACTNIRVQLGLGKVLSVKRYH